jgi:hypothetical protein
MRGKDSNRKQPLQWRNWSDNPLLASIAALAGIVVILGGILSLVTWYRHLPLDESTEVRVDPFFSALREDEPPLAARLGPPISAAVKKTIVIQQFELGFMIWHEKDPTTIRVCYDAHRQWVLYQDVKPTQAEWTEYHSLPKGSRALFFYGGSFIRSWLHYGLRPRLGLPEAKEHTLETSLIQKFARGEMMRDFPGFNRSVRSYIEVGPGKGILVLTNESPDGGTWSLSG